jgi:hypothetical protein
VGQPGTMLAARALDRLDLWHESARLLRDAWENSGLWTQDLYGDMRQFVGPAHGFAGCVAALAHEPNEDLHRRASETFKRLAVEEDGLANWPALADAQLVGRDGTIRTQWCHGAPGMVACLAEIAPGDDEHEPAGCRRRADLARGSAREGREPLPRHSRERPGVPEAVWTHRDELWLERARAFAMHAGAQVERERRDLGRGHSTLWTGDPGTALYLALCIDGSASLPGFDDNDFV